MAGGKTRRATAVSSGTPGVAMTMRMSSGQRHPRSSTRPSSPWQLSVMPPMSAAAALSGWPSSSHASDSQSSASRGDVTAS